MRGRGPFQFTAAELFVLAAGFAVASLIIFVLGIVVGRGVAFEHSPVDARVARLPVEPAADQAVAARPKAAFGGRKVPTSKTSKVPTKPSLPSVRTVSAEDRAGRPAAGQGTVSLQGHAGKAHTSQPRPAGHRKSVGQHGAGGTFLLTDDSHVAPSRRAVPAYTVQVLSTRDAGAAESLVRSLKTRGLGAYVRPAQDSTGRWFRVRIGRFGELGAARALAARCRKDLRLDQAYVVSD